jgi:hypothetical protein
MNKLAFLTLPLLALFLILAAPILTGCAKAAPLPTGAYAPLDASINESLQAAHAAIVQYSADVRNGIHTPTADERTAVNKLIGALNIADPAYQAYHAQLAANPSAPEPAALIAALSSVVSNLSALEALIK